MYSKKWMNTIRTWHHIISYHVNAYFRFCPNHTHVNVIRMMSSINKLWWRLDENRFCRDAKFGSDHGVGKVRWPIDCGSWICYHKYMSDVHFHFLRKATNLQLWITCIIWAIYKWIVRIQDRIGYLFRIKAWDFQTVFHWFYTYWFWNFI